MTGITTRNFWRVVKQKLGETHMTGRGNAFYEKLGFGKGWHWNFYGR